MLFSKSMIKLFYIHFAGLEFNPDPLLLSVSSNESSYVFIDVVHVRCHSEKNLILLLNFFASSTPRFHIPDSCFFSLLAV